MSQNRADPTFPNLAGIALCASGQHRDALSLFRKALKLAPSYHDARKNLAQTLTVLNHPDLAKAQLSKLLKLTPRDSEIWFMLAQVHLSANELSDALKAANEMIALDARQTRYFNLRALLHNRLGHSSEAIADFEAALLINPDDVETLINISLPLARQNRHAEATQAVRHAVDLSPDHVGAQLRLAAQHVEMGDPASAITAYEKVLELAPETPEAYENLAILLPPDEAVHLTGGLARAFEKSKPKTIGRAQLSYASARLAEKADDPSGMAQWLERANREMARIMPFNGQHDEDITQRIMDYFPDRMTVDPDTDCKGPRPIFVVGLPRSGTTLAEAVLGAHPGVTALGERAAAGILLFPMIGANAPFDQEARENFVRRDREMLPNLEDGTRAYVDKMPENYRLIGFLKSAYPGCRIINIRRDPRDIALSMWKVHFSGAALSYSNNLVQMADHFNRYVRMMEHWHKVLPGQILDITYEGLVDDITTTSRRMADFCGLEWVADMAQPHKSAGPTLTATASQLRQPVHHRSVGGWQAHQTMLAPFVQRLGPDLWPEVN